MSTCCEAVKDARMLLTATEAAKLAGCGKRTWLRWTACGLAPKPKRIGLGVRPAVRWARSDIESWIEGGCKPIEPAKRYEPDETPLRRRLRERREASQ